MSTANSASAMSRRDSVEKHDDSLRLVRARSAFVHEVAWVRIAPITISILLSAGHQC
jgi:hypothetical protein